MKILVVGSGGREHALLWALNKSARRQLKLYCAPGNAGIADIAECVEIGATDITSLVQFAEEQKIDLTIAGSEAPLAAGIVDEFERRKLMIAGASRDAARLESSKAFAKDFMARHNIPTARYRIADSISYAQRILESGEFGGRDSSVVIKADGLAAGKGVIVARSRSEASSGINDLMEGSLVGTEAARRIVIEEALTGREASLLLFADGRNYALMPPARDHKRIGENDTGPNTGGMGAITDASVLDEGTLTRVVRDVVEPTLEGARSEGFPFRGVLFVGLMLTVEGPRVLEYNVRFGDPEAQAILVRLQTDPVDVFEAVARGRLGETSVQWSGESSACVVLASRGYPARPETGARIEGLDLAAQHEGVRIFHAGTARSDAGDWITAGGRVLGVTATAGTLELALDRCYDAVSDIHWDGMYYRRDIGKFTESRSQNPESRIQNE
ncbi:MAG: phosphoribosylamine---glycine ligase [Acidobacteriota bacterium]|jgi:phosphoribosylamine--glycine ligase|nr:phosphoribosylamine---glycine ligase [Acidobacteriota bacterium]